MSEFLWVLGGSLGFAFVVATITTNVFLRKEHEALKRRVDAMEYRS